MVSYLTSSIPLVALTAMVIAVLFASLIFYALRNKGDVCAELTHGKTRLRIDARDRRDTKKL
jgi:hypothetical protein